MPYLPAVIVLMLIYMASLIGFTTPHQQQWFLYYTPYIVLLNALLLILYHRPFKRPFFAFLGLSLGLSTLLEVLAVQSTALYGNYAFGGSLGPQVQGVAWVMPWYAWVLAYSAGVLSDRLPVAGSVAKVAVGVLLMTGLAVLVHQVAPLLDFWSAVPIGRYALVWGILGVVLQSAWQRWAVVQQNAIAGFVYGGLLIFFTGVLMFLS